jgi:hypothetical protein
MAVGSQSDMLARLKAVLPAGWFPLTPAGQPSTTPILDGILSGPAWMLAQAFALISYVQLQQRIATATGIFLDLASLDYFGANLPRKNAESNPAFSARIRANLLPPLGTRPAVIQALTRLTGTEPIIFEPFMPGDAGAYNYGGLGYNVAGGYGCLAIPAQAFVTAFRQIEGGVPNVAGYNGNETAPVYAPGGYGVGLIEYATLDQAGTQVDDAEIYATVAATQASGVTLWTRIENPTP